MELEIKFIGKEALVRISKRLFEQRGKGLIQFLSSFCNHIKWSVEGKTELY